MRSQRAKIIFRNARRIEEDWMFERYQRQLLKLPLVRYYGRVCDLIEVGLSAAKVSKFLRKLRRTNAFRALAHDKNLSAALDDMLHGGDPFNRLIERQVERIACGARDDR